jgi:ParB/RepB/Spo0J family partition protein
MPEREQTTRLIPLCRIYPDPTQPRKFLPPDLAAALASGALPFDILNQLRSRAERDKWTRERLVKLDALAGSIAADGLMQPIRVIPDGDDRYKIEEGERRWWAHQSLAQQGKEQFQNVAAFVVEPDGASSGLLRRRVAENVLRSDFTAIELARAMASRIQEILAAEPGTKRGDAERRVGKENGLSDRRVRQFVALLTLSPEVQELAQQARLSENSLRPIVGIKDATRQLAMVRELIHPLNKKIISRSPARAHSKFRAKSKLRPRARGKSSLRPARRKTKDTVEKHAVQTIRKVVTIAKSLRAEDWTRAMKEEQIRRGLSGLRDSLDKALRTKKESR